MPLVVVSGIPSSGKSTTANKLKDYFESKKKKVYVVSETDIVLNKQLNKNTVYKSTKNEKEVRDEIKSEVLRHLNGARLVIVDASNHIKGFRYELFCIAKSASTPYCVAFCDVTEVEATTLNNGRSADQQYTEEALQALNARYKRPDPLLRWDSPLFAIHLNEQLCLGDIDAALYESQPLPPNDSTQNAPVESTNFIYDIDQTTEEITQIILKALQTHCQGEVELESFKDVLVLPTGVTAARVTALRRQFLVYYKTQMLEEEENTDVASLFIDYLKENL